MILKDKIAIITGAGQGIGKALAYKFAREGAKLVICDINYSNIKKVEDELLNEGFEVKGLEVDISDPEQVEEMAEKVNNIFGRIDILVNNAGITRDSFFEKMNDEKWHKVIDVNLNGTYYCTKSVLKTMKKNSYGRIINISSAGRFGNIGQSNYSASKAAVVGLTRALAKEVGINGINVNAVAPGAINTDMFSTVPEKVVSKMKKAIPLNRLGEPYEVANICAFLASDEASYITGQTIQCDGGVFMP